MSYVLKFDDPKQFERASTADVVGSKLYYAAGFQVPCNRVVYLRSTDLVVSDEPPKPGKKQITRERIDELLKLARQEEQRHLPRDGQRVHPRQAQRSVVLQRSAGGRPQRPRRPPGPA